MEREEFAERLARVRQRFATALPGRIDDSFAALPRLSAEQPDDIETLVVTHRRLHEMCGIAPTIGFPETGKAARAAETVLREPALSKRPLTGGEVSALRAELEGLRAVAQSELRATPGAALA